MSERIQAVCVHDDGFEHPSDGSLPCPIVAGSIADGQHVEWLTEVADYYAPVVEVDVLRAQLRDVDKLLRIAGYEGGPRVDLMRDLVTELLSRRELP